MYYTISPAQSQFHITPFALHLGSGLFRLSRAGEETWVCQLLLPPGISPADTGEMDLQIGIRCTLEKRVEGGGTILAGSASARLGSHPAEVEILLEEHLT